MIRPDLRIRRLEPRLHRAFIATAHRRAADVRRHLTGLTRTRKEGSQ